MAGRIIDPSRQADERITRRLGVPTRREMTRAQQLAERHQEAKGVEIQNADTIAIRAAAKMRFAGGVNVQMVGDVAQVSLASVTAPSYTLLAAAGATATAALTGNDDTMQVQIVPGGAGIAAGSVITITFGAARAVSTYAVLVSPNSSAARTLGGVVGCTSRGTGGFDLATATALTSGSTYQFSVRIVDY